MVLRSILNKINPINANEKCFYEAFLRTRSVDSDPRSLIFYFINESTLYSEATTLAESAISWAKELEENYSKFESSVELITACDEDAFSIYCLHKNWNLKRNSKDLIAREGTKFKAKFELSSKKVYMILDNKEPLQIMHILNELEAS